MTRLDYARCSRTTVDGTRGHLDMITMDVCIGYGTAEHDAPASELTTASGYLCAACADRLDREVRPYAYGVYPAGKPAPACPNGHTDRTAHYFSCLYCYGD